MPLFDRKPQKDDAQHKATLLYRNVFIENANGREVLNMLLRTCGLFKKIETEEQRVLHNWGVYLLYNLGLNTLDATGMVDYHQVIDAIAKIGNPYGKGVDNAGS